MLTIHDETPENLLFGHIGRYMPRLFDDFPNITFDNYFEGLILGCYLGATSFKNKKPCGSDDFEFKFFPILTQVAIKQQMFDKFPRGFGVFLSDRLLTYIECFGFIQNKTHVNRAMAKISSNLYLAPLGEGGMGGTPETWTTTWDRVGAFFDSIDSSVDEVILQLNSLSK